MTPTQNPPALLPDDLFLMDLAGRLFRHAAPSMGFDQGDTDRLYRIARGLSTPAEPKVSREAVASMLKTAFQQADPTATYKFDWADFGDVQPTDMGALVIDAMLAALSNPPADGDGWRWVPVEATEAMIDKAWPIMKLDDSGPEEIWSAMLAAASPSAPLGAASQIGEQP